MRTRERITVAAIVITCLLGGGRQAMGQAYVTRNGTSFQVNGGQLKFMGFNVRGICHYGHGDALPYSQTSHIAYNLDYCVSAESKVIRVFCAYHGIDAQETGDRLEVILDACQARGMWALVALTDMYDASGMYPQGDGVYYVPSGDYNVLNHTFFASGYTNNYLPQVLYLTDRFKNHPAVFAWQLGNEIRDIWSGSTFLAFCQDVTAQIRAVDPNHMISAGLIDSWYAGISPTQLYAYFDFVNSHNYNGGGGNDSGLANQLNKPYVIDEAGFDSAVYGPDRTPESNADIVKWINNRGADGYMQWGLMASGYDNGDGDRYLGVDQVFHYADFWAYRDLFNAWGSSFELPPTLVVDPAFIEQTIEAGSNAPDDVFTVSNGGSGSFAFSVNESIGWLWVSPASGQANLFGTVVTIHYDAATLSPGDHVGLIEVVAGGIPNSPQYVEVTLLVEGSPGDIDGDGDVDQEDFGLFQACMTAAGVEQLDPDCRSARMDDDPDVDVDDLDLFRGCMTGPGVPADPQCAG